jgi:antitoxin FitA
MPKTIQIRNIDDDVYAELRKRAAEDGLSVPDLLRREAERLVSRPSMKQWLERVGRKPISDVQPGEVLEALDEWRGPWPDADR